MADNQFFDGTTWYPAQSAQTYADGATASQRGALAVIPTWFQGSAVWAMQRGATKFIVLTTVAIGTEATIWTPTSGKKFRLMGFQFATSASVFINLRDNTGGTIIYRIGQYLSTNSIITPPDMDNGILSAAANNVLTATASGACNLDGVVFGTEE